MTYDPRIPKSEDCVLGKLLEIRAEEKPDVTAILFEDGESWTWAETLEKTRRVASGLAALGVEKSDHVLSWLPNGKEAVLTWFALNYLGAVYVPVNVAYRGSLLQHIVQLSDAKLIVCHSELAPRLSEIDPGDKLGNVVLTGSLESLSGFPSHRFTDLESAPADVELVEVEPWDTMYIIFTSGTTGPSKAVLSSYLHAYATGIEGNPYFEEEDRILVNLPLFHVGGTLFIYQTVVKGASCVLVDSFDTKSLWPIIRKFDITFMGLLGAMPPFLLSQPPSDRDRDHPLRYAMAIPWNEDSLAVAERFGIAMRTTFNMTEISAPLISDENPPVMGTCGKPRDGVEVRVVDKNDCEVAPGDIGELIVRTDRPWSMNHGYYRNPEATAEAWRNGWFHTGDAFRYDEEGNFYFVDRLKDTIRRRGENISSFEVESEVSLFAGVSEVAAIPVPSELGEDEVMIVVTVADDGDFEPETLFRFLESRMAHFMLPRYIRVIDKLPKTPTQKVQKNLLKQEGVTQDTWDREIAGIKVKRTRLT